jgi:hypothetical protein
MYLDGDRLAVLSSRWTPTNPSSPSPPAGGDRMGTWAPGRQETVLTVFDVTDPTAPKVVRETALDGWSVDSRVVDGKLVLVLQNDLFVAAGPPVWMLRGGAATTMAPGSWGGSTADFRRLPIDRVLPSYRGFVVSPTGVKTSQSGLISRAGEVLRPQSEGDGNLISVLVFDLHGTTSGPEAAASVVGSYASTVYATADTITLFTPRWEGESSTTAIQQFRFDGAGVKLIATGAVSGTPINAFAADQVGDTLRVATTTGWGTSATSAVTVLKREGDRLVTAGAVTGLAPGETIQSVRYVGDRAYVVTFLQVDPLFVIDLADPTAPRVAGELKLPGFSRYLHPLGGDRLLGIGRDADPETGRTKGIQLTLFDVAGPGNPKLVGTQTVTPPDGSSWRWSDAEWDHHAFSYFPELGLVAVPVQGGTMEATPGGEPSWRASSELMLYQVNPNTGFTPMGVVQHDSPVLRSLRIEDVIYSVAIGDLKATRLTGGGPSTVGAVSLPVPDPTPGPGPAVPV